MTAANEKRLRESLDAFCALTGIPATVYDPEGGQRAEFMAEGKACRLFRPYENTGECGKNRLFSIQLAGELGEAYVYECPSGFVHIAAPILAEGRMEACAVAGPLIMGEMDEEMLEKITASNRFSPVQLARSAVQLAMMSKYTPLQMQKISVLFFDAVLTGSRSWADCEQRSSLHKRQLAAGERIQKRKVATVSETGVSLAELEERLLQTLRRGEREGALQCLDQLLGELLLVEGGNLDRVKLRLFEIYIAISRAASEQGIALRRVFGGEAGSMAALSETDSVEELTGRFRELVIYFCDELFASLPAVPDQMQQALAYVAAHYGEKLTLGGVADELFLSESSLSKLFRQKLGTSFTDYLNSVRIGRARELLEHTDMSLLDISTLVGFADQSYFTKVFIKYTGRTPRQYKKHPVDEKGEKP